MTTRLSEANPEALFSPLIQHAFIPLLERRLRRSFHAVRLARPGMPAVDGHTPLIVYCNHPSWWDLALIPVLLHRLLPMRRAYGPIDAQALHRYGFMKHLGLFGIEPGTYAGAATFLRVGRRVLAGQHTLLCLTPQGRFVDPRVRPVKLQPGLAGLVSTQTRVTCLPLAVEYPFWTESTPEAIARFGTPLTVGTHVHGSLYSLHDQLTHGLSSTMDRLADDALSQDPARFSEVLNGRVGVGGIYDVWRRLRSWQAGDKFDPAHVRASDRDARL